MARTEYQKLKAEIGQWLPTASKRSVKPLGKCLYLRASGDGKNGYLMYRYKKPHAKASTFAGLGHYPADMTLKQALELRDRLTVGRKDGIDPQTHVQQLRATTRRSLIDTSIKRATTPDTPDKLTESSTFYECALHYHARKRRTNPNNPKLKPWTEQNGAVWLARIRNHLGPILHERVGAITPGDMIQTVEDLWCAHPNTTRRVLASAEQIFNNAYILGLHPGPNPARLNDFLEALLPEVDTTETPRPAMGYRDAPAFMETLAGIEAQSARAGELIIMTGCRVNEVLQARWEEIDRDEMVWRIPHSRMKMKRDHVIPITGALLEKLDALPRWSSSPFMFPAIRVNERTGTKTMALSTLNKFKDRQGWKGWTWHGFRSTFRTWAADARQDEAAAELVLAHRDKAIDRQLAQVEKGVQGRYDRSELIEERRELLREWHAFLAGNVAVGNFGQRKAG